MSKTSEAIEAAILKQLAKKPGIGLVELSKELDTNIQEVKLAVNEMQAHDMVVSGMRKDERNSTISYEKTYYRAPILSKA